MTRNQSRTMLLTLLTLGLVGCTAGNHREFLTAPTQEQVFTARANDPYAVSVDASTWARLRSDLTQAQQSFDETPTDEEAIIWLGRRQAYLGLYHEAIATFSRGLTFHPDSAALRRHRGHRFITIRHFERAEDDLTRAARLVANEPDEIEPDGAPNALGIPRSTLKTNIYYHLALTHYLPGDFEQARDAWRMCADLSPNDDMLIASLYWLYLTNMRMNDHAAAQSVLTEVSPSMDIIENFDYHALLLMYKGEVAPEDLLDFESGTGVEQATRAYGVAMRHWLTGETETALDILERIAREANPAAFGAIASEVDLRRLSPAL